MARGDVQGYEYDPNDPYAGLDPAWLDQPETPAPDPTTPAPVTASAKMAAENADPNGAGGEGGGGSPAPGPSGGGSAAPDPSNPMDPGNQPGPNGVGAPGNATNAIAGYYGTFLHRDASPDEIAYWLNSGDDLGTIQNKIANSKEAMAWAAANPGGPAPNPKPGVGTGATPGTTGNSTADALIAALMARLSGTTAASSSATGVDPELRKSLMSAISVLIDQGLAPVGDVSQSQQAKAYQIASQRNAEQNRSAAAERRASQGLLFSGPMETDINAVQQQRSESQSRFEAELTTTLLNDKRTKLVTALHTGAGIMSADQQAQLQAELNATNAELAKSQLQLALTNSILSNAHFYDDLGYRIGATEAGLNTQAGSSLI